MSFFEWTPSRTRKLQIASCYAARSSPTNSKSVDGIRGIAMNSQNKSPKIDDCVINAIQNGKLTARNISFQKIRSLCNARIRMLSAAEDNQLKESLGRGRNILQTAPQLDKYAYTHGRMIPSQWSHVFGMLNWEPRQQTHVIDYGCGQGLSTSLFLDNYGKEYFNFIEKITLIEPSPIALERAKAIIGCYSDKIEIKTMNMDFDSFNREKAEGNTGGLTCHLFSNVLDFSGYDHLELLNNAISTPGTNLILAVSHDRKGSPYIRACKDKVESLKADEKFTVKENFIETFRCNDDKNDAIAFLAEVKVHDGLI